MGVGCECLSVGPLDRQSMPTSAHHKKKGGKKGAKERVKGAGPNGQGDEDVAFEYTEKYALALLPSATTTTSPPNCLSVAQRVQVFPFTTTPPVPSHTLCAYVVDWPLTCTTPYDRLDSCLPWAHTESMFALCAHVVDVVPAWPLVVGVGVSSVHSIVPCHNHVSSWRNESLRPSLPFGA